MLSIVQYLNRIFFSRLFLALQLPMEIDKRIMVLGHSFLRRLADDLDAKFDARASKDFNLKGCNVRLFGIGGRTVTKLRSFDLGKVSSYRPDILLLEVGTNDISLAHKSAQSVGSEIEEFTTLILDRFGVKVIGVFLTIPRADEVLNSKAKRLNQYLKVVLGDRKNIFVWGHRNLMKPANTVLLSDGVHLNKWGQYRLYRSYRGAIIHALKVLAKIDS